jgi:hypothetical protein
MRKKMEKKKEYVAPEMETVELKTQVNLLGESDPPNPYDDENG